MDSAITPSLISGAIELAMKLLSSKIGQSTKDAIELLLKHIDFLQERNIALEHDNTILKSEISSLKSDLIALQRNNIALQNSTFALQAKLLSLQDEKSSIQSGYIELQTKSLEEKTELQKQANRFDKELKWQKTREKYQFDERFGFVRSRETNHPYCPECLNAEPPKEQPLPDAHKFTAEISCPLCKSAFRNPEYSAEEWNAFVRSRNKPFSIL